MTKEEYRQIRDGLDEYEQDIKENRKEKSAPVSSDTGTDNKN